MKSKKPVKNRYKGALRPGSENYMYGGYQYMYGGEYKAGGTLQDIGSFAYGTLEGIVDPLTGNLLDPLTDKGFEELQKLGNKNIDLTDEKDLKEIEKQNKLRGAGEIAGAITAGVINPASAVSAVGTGLEGANRIVQNSDVSDKTRQIANISTQIGSTATGIASGSGLAEGIAPFAKTADQLDNWMNIGKAVQVGSQFLPQGNDLASQARAIQAQNDAIAGLYPDANVQYYGKGGKLGNKIGKLRREGYPQDQAVAIAYSMQERNELGNGGYVVSKSDRKGKTHKVTGPDGTVKHFGDPNLKNRPNNPEAKKSWYARHKKNLDKNPHFRAYARATWAEGGNMDTDPKDKKKIDTSTPLSFIKSAAEYRGITPEQFINLAEKIGIHESINLDPKRIQELDSGRTGKGRGVYQFEPASAESALVRFEEILKENNNGVIPEWANELYNYDSIPELTTLMQTVLAAADLSEKKNFILKKAVESDEALAEQWGIGWQTENDPAKKKRFLENIQSDRAKKLQGSLMKTLQEENKAYESSTEAKPIKVDSATTTTSMQTHTIAPGETFYGIANKYNINKDSLVKANPNIKSIHSIQIGQDINIPSQKAMGGMIDKNVMMQDLYGKGGKIGLWDRIRAKRARIAAGSGERKARPGNQDRPTEEAWAAAQASSNKAAMGGLLYAQGGDMSKENPIQKYNDYKSYVEKARQAIGTNDTKLLKELGGSRPYDNNDLARDFGELQRLRKEAGLGISEEAQILFPHVGQQMRGSLNQWFGTNYAQGGSFDNPGFKALPKEVQMQIMANTNAYGGKMYANGGSFDNPGFRALPAEVQAKIKGEAMGYGGKMYAQGGAMDMDPAEAILNAPKGKYSPEMRKKANFAKNFAKAYGGNMYAYGGELPYSFEMGGEMLQTIDNGGTHEQNPNGGVPATPDGMNLVEEGETVMNGNFVFSNRLKVTPEIAREFNLGKKAVGKTYADVSKSYKDEERPNDRFINRANERTLDNLAEAQESYKAVEQAKYQQTNQELQQAMQMQQMQDMMGQQMGAPMNEQQMMQQMMMQQMAQGQMPQQGMPQQQMGYGGKMMYFEGGDMPNPDTAPETTFSAPTTKSPLIISTENNPYPQDPLWARFAEVGSAISEYSYGAKGKRYSGEYGEKYEYQIDCSGAVCKVINTSTGQEVYDINNTNATKLQKNLENARQVDSTNVDELNKLPHGSVITMMNKGPEGGPHVGMVLVDAQGNRYLAESSSSYNEVTVTPLAQRIQDINASAKDGYTFTVGDSLKGFTPDQFASEVLAPIADPTSPAGTDVSEQAVSVPEDYKPAAPMVTIPESNAGEATVENQPTTYNSSLRNTSQIPANLQKAQEAYRQAQGEEVAQEAQAAIQAGAQEPTAEVNKPDPALGRFASQAIGVFTNPVTASGYYMNQGYIPMNLYKTEFGQEGTNPFDLPFSFLMGSAAASKANAAIRTADKAARAARYANNARSATAGRQAPPPGTEIARTNEMGPYTGPTPQPITRTNQVGPYIGSAQSSENLVPYYYPEMMEAAAYSSRMAPAALDPNLIPRAEATTPEAVPQTTEPKKPDETVPNEEVQNDTNSEGLKSFVANFKYSLADTPGYQVKTFDNETVEPKSIGEPNKSPIEEVSNTEAQSNLKNLGKYLQFAPVAANAAGMIQAMLDRPDYIQPEQTNVDFTYTPMDMTQARADAATAMRTGMRGAAAGSRGSVGSYMDATERITGATARGLGQTAMQQDLYNRQQQMQSRQQQFQQAAQNAQQRAMATQFNQQSDAARTDRILEMMMGMGQNLGEIGTRAMYGDQAGKIYFYNTEGDKIKNTTDNGD